MSNKLKKKDSPLSLAFSKADVNILKELLDKEIQDGLILKLQLVIECHTNGKNQLSLFKEFVLMARTSEISTLEALLSPLCDMFIYCASRHPLRRSIASFFQGCQDDMKNEAMKILHAKLDKYFKCIVEVDRKHVELVSSLMENFPIGDQVVANSYTFVLQALIKCYSVFMESLRNGVSVILQNEMMANCLATLKTILAVLLKSKDQLSKDILSRDDTSSLMFELCIISRKAACNSIITLECICAAAMLLPSLILQLPENNLAKLLYNVLLCFNKCEVQQDSDNLTDTIMISVTAYVRENENSKIAILHACLVKLPIDFLFSTDNNVNYMEKLFLPELINLASASNNKHILVLSFKTIYIWIGKILETKKQQHSHSVETESVSDLIYHLLKFINHPIDTIRHNVTQALGLCFEYLDICNEKVFIRQLCIKHLTKNFATRGQVMIAKALVKHTSIHELVITNKNLPETILSNLKNSDLSVHACNLYDVLSNKHLQEISSDSIHVWLTTWVHNLQPIINSDEEEIKKGIVEYVIPSLIKSYPQLWSVYDQNKVNSIDSSRFSILLLKTYRGMKNFNVSSYVKFEYSSDDKIWKSLIPMDHMMKCCVHIDEQVRLDTLYLVCSSSKTTESIDENDLELLKHFCSYNFTSDMPSFRQQVVVNFKKIFLRIFSYTYQSKDNIEENQIFINFYKWFIKICFEKLYLNDAPYSQVSLSLELLNLIAKIFKENESSTILRNLNINDDCKVTYTRKLIDMFQDTYEPNRLLVYNILKSESNFSTMLSIDEHQNILSDILTRLGSPQPDISSVSAYLVAYLSHAVPNSQASKLFQSFELKYFKLKNNTTLCFLDLLNNILRKQFVEIKQSLYRGAQVAPLYGVLHSIRTLFTLEKLSTDHELVSSNHVEFELYLTESIDLFLEIVQLVSNYVSSSAPEGNLCDANLSEIFEQLNLNVTDTNIEIESHIARMILVCCWRSMKEVSLLLGNIVTNFTNNKNGINILHMNVLKKIWCMFTDILLRSKHAGAYELAALGFIKLCHVFWHTSDKELKLIPQKAVSDLVEELCSSIPFDKGQVTRRSGGLPFYLKALCGSEPEINCNKTFHFLMSSLVNFATKSLSAKTNDVNKLVVSLNILRAFFKDSSLAEEIHEYVSDGVKIAINGISSCVWGIRNSSTLLFSALMQRIFGVKKYKMTGREFFSRYLSLYDFLLKYVEDICSTITRKDSNLHPSLFPLLLLLSHLYPASVQGSETLMELNKFIPLVFSCGYSHVYKIRTMVARALVPLISKDKTQSYMMEIISTIKENTSNKSQCNENYLHSSYLQLLELLRSLLTDSSLQELDENIMEFCLDQREFLKTESRYISKAVAMEIACLLVANLRNSKYQQFYEDAFSHTLDVILNKQSHNAKPGYVLFIRHTTNFICIYMKHCVESNSFANNKLLVDLAGMDLEDLSFTILDFIAVNNQLLFTLESIHQMLKYLEEVNVTDLKFIKLGSALVTMLSSFPDVLPSTLYSKLWSILRVDSSNVRDELAEYTVEFINVIFKANISNLDKILEKEIWDVLYNSSLDTNAFNVRLKVAEVMQYVRFDEHFQSNPELCYPYFHCCIHLLRDVDSQVRTTAAKSLQTPGMIGSQIDTDDYFIAQPDYVMKNKFKDQLTSQFKYDPQNFIIFATAVVTETSYSNLIKDNIYGKSTSNFIDDCEFVKQFVVFEDSKRNPYFDYSMVCNFLLNVMKTERPETYALMDCDWLKRHIEDVMRKRKDNMHVKKLRNMLFP